MTDLATRLTKLYSHIEWDSGTDQEWLESVTSKTTTKRRPSSAPARRRGGKNRFENWYSEAMSDRAKKNNANSPAGNDNIRMAATKNAKKISQEEFDNWYRTAIRSKKLSAKHLKEKYNIEQRAGADMNRELFDADKFSQWYEKSVSTFRKKHGDGSSKNVGNSYSQRVQSPTFDPSHFENWYDKQVGGR